MKMNLARTVIGIGLGLLALAPERSHADRAAKQVLIEAKIVEVVSGDRMKMVGDGGLKELRLFGVDAPAPGRPYADEARDFTARLVDGESVQAKVFMGLQGSVLTGDIVLPGGETLGGKLVEEGLASWDHEESLEERIAELEMTARLKRKGMWSQRGLTPSFASPGATSAMAGPGRLDAITADIMQLSDGDKARLGQRLIGILPMPAQGGVGQTTLIIRESQPYIIDSHGNHDYSRRYPTSRPSGGPSTHGDGGNLGGGGVYLDSSGSMFHRASCFKGGSTGEGISRSDAVARGAVPCPKCRP